MPVTNPEQGGDNPQISEYDSLREKIAVYQTNPQQFTDAFLAQYKDYETLKSALTDDSQDQKDVAAVRALNEALFAYEAPAKLKAYIEATVKGNEWGPAGVTARPELVNGQWNVVIENKGVGPAATIRLHMIGNYQSNFNEADWMILGSGCTYTSGLKGSGLVYAADDVYAIETYLDQIKKGEKSPAKADDEAPFYQGGGGVLDFREGFNSGVKVLWLGEIEAQEPNKLVGFANARYQMLKNPSETMPPTRPAGQSSEVSSVKVAATPARVEAPKVPEVHSEAEFVAQLRAEGGVEKYMTQTTAPDGTRHVTLHLPTKADVLWSRIQNFEGEDGKAAIGLGKPEEFILKSGGKDYEWKDGTWKDAAGKRLLVVDGTQYDVVQKPKVVAEMPPTPEGQPVNPTVVPAPQGEVLKSATPLAEFDPDAALDPDEQAIAVQKAKALHKDVKGIATELGRIQTELAKADLSTTDRTRYQAILPLTEQRLAEAYQSLEAALAALDRGVPADQALTLKEKEGLTVAQAEVLAYKEVQEKEDQKIAGEFVPLDRAA